MNVVVIACNSLHLGFLGAYGNAWIGTPNFDRLASESVVFDAYFPENLTTLPTRRSWWTGRYGFHDPALGWTPLRNDEPILPDLLWNHGVATALISDVPYLREPENGFGRGFDEVVWIRGQGYDPCVPPGDPRAANVRIEDEPGLRLPPRDDPDFEIWHARWEQYLRNRAALGLDRLENAAAARPIRAASDWLERRARSTDPAPFLLWLDLFSPHGPWDPPQPYRDLYAAEDPDEFETGSEGDLADEELADLDDVDLLEIPVLIDVPAGAVGDVLDEFELLRLRRTYAGVVSLLDAQVGELIGTLERLGRLDDTMIIFVADQGEPLGEHGFVRRFRPWLHEELIHAPLMIRLPGGERGGERRDALVQSVDLFPTILAAFGATPPDEPAVHGRDLNPLLRGEPTKTRDYACMGMDVEEFAIRTPEWHLILPVEVDPDDPPRGVQLYRKPEDRWEQNDLASRHPDVALALELALRRFVAALERDALDELPAGLDLARLHAE